MKDTQHPEDALHDVGYLVHSFDLLHVGHLDLLRQAGELCHSLHVGVVPDEMVLEHRGRPAVVPFEERLELLRHVRGVDAVLTHGRGTAPAGALLLVARGEQYGVSPDVVLRARRVTASLLLRRALAPSLVEGSRQVPA